MPTHETEGAGRQGPVVIHVEEPPPPRLKGPCPATDGPHRWAYLAHGGQACGYCGRPR